MTDEDLQYQSRQEPAEDSSEQGVVRFNWLPLAIAIVVAVSGYVGDLDYYLIYLPVVILIHELGHVVFGLLFKCEVEKLQIFFFPFITYQPKQHDDDWSSWRNITWRLGVLPLGGYTQFWSRAEYENNIEILANVGELDDDAVEGYEYFQNISSTESPFIDDKPAWKRLLIYLGGVTFNFLTFLLLLAIYRTVGFGDSSAVGDFLYAVMVVSLILAVLNLFPIYPLDGGVILFHLYEIITGREPSARFKTWCSYIGIVIILLLFWVLPYFIPNFMSGFFDRIFDLFLK